MKAVFLDRDGTITKSTDLVSSGDELILEEHAASGIKIFNEAGIKVFVVTNQPQVARGMVSEQDVERMNEKMVKDLEAGGAKIDAVYYCPHHPEMHRDVPEHARKYRIVCECRKPKAGMIREAAGKFDIDLNESYVIGDRTVDIMAGKNAGCRTILVKTGHGGLDGKHDVVPDFEADNLIEAAKIVTMEKTRAVILVGGKGERLGEMTKSVPKPLIPIGGKPVVEHQIDLLKEAGVRSVVLCGSHMIDKIKEYFGDGRRFGVHISYTEEPEPMGTGGAVKLAEPFVKGCDTVIVSNGDIMLRGVNFREIVKYHKNRQALVTMILRETDHPKDSDVVKINGEGRVVEFIGRGQEKYTTGNTGIFVAGSSVFKFIPEGKSNIEKDVLSKIFFTERIYGFKILEGWIAKDMGTPDRLESLRKIFGD